MIRALTRIGFGKDACLIAPKVAGGIDAMITIHPLTVERPFIRDWRLDGDGAVELDLHWPSTPRGAA